MTNPDFFSDTNDSSPPNIPFEQVDEEHIAHINTPIEDLFDQEPNGFTYTEYTLLQDLLTGLSENSLTDAGHTLLHSLLDDFIQMIGPTFFQDLLSSTTNTPTINREPTDTAPTGELTDTAPTGELTNTAPTASPRANTPPPQDLGRPTTPPSAPGEYHYHIVNSGLPSRNLLSDFHHADDSPRQQKRQKPDSTRQGNEQTPKRSR